MHTLPTDVVHYKSTPTFDETTIPDGLRKCHDTKDGVWGKIVVLEGELLYRIVETNEEVVLTAERPGVAAPCERHQVEPRGKVKFYVEFHR